MSVTAARTRLDELTRRWNRRRAGAAVLVALAALLLVAGVRSHVGTWLALAVGAVAIVAGSWWALRGTRAGTDVMALHLDRVVPELEESSTLVLREPAELGPLARLQQDRVAARIQTMAEAPLPSGPVTRGAAAALAIALVALTTFAPSPAPGAAPVLDTHGRAPAPPTLAGLSITVAPPAYTRLPARSATPDLDVEDGARVIWRITASRAERVYVVTFDGDTLPATDSAGSWVVSVVAHAPTIYRIVAEGTGGRTMSPLHRLAVRPDEAPTLTFVTPDDRTEIPHGEPLRVPVAVLATDDYGIDRSALVVTVTSGAGEQVRFRERRLAFTASEPRPGHARLLRAMLDLAALGMGPGDEAYVHAEASDTRRPTANEARSATVVVALADTGSAPVADFAGLPRPVPATALRSQRQVIIETERLLAERTRLTTAEFRRRAAEITSDQHQLRLRYGALVGGESEGEPDSPMSDLLAELGHQHDVAENETLLAPEVKRTLRDAVASMWEAERQLGTFEIRGALPHEYSALARLKEVQQAGRAYVRKTAVELPPIDMGRRLTGEQGKVTPPRSSRAATATVPLPASREALAVLSGLRAGAPIDTTARARLEEAGRELASLAARDRGALAALQAVRGVLDSLVAPAPCGGCLATADSALWVLVPPIGPLPGSREPESRVGAAYADRLAGAR